MLTKMKESIFPCLLISLAMIMGVFCGIQEKIPVEAEESVITQHIYHKHTGNTEKKGGCYQKRVVETKQVEVPCPGKMIYYPEYGTTGCNVCGSAYQGDQSFRECWKFTYRTEEVVTYQRNCGKTTKDIVATVTVKKSTDEWTKSLSLIANVEANGIVLSQAPYIWNGTASSNPNLEVAENGTYTLQIAADANANTAKASLSVTVDNIDHTGPTCQGQTILPENWTKDKVTVTVQSVSDTQPNGEAGCGLADKPYSFDGGKTWTSDNSYIYAQNGTYSVQFKDKLGNISSKNIVISNIDKKGPTIQSLDYDQQKNIAATTLTVVAKDLQEDNSAGAGLAKDAYSFDGGKTFSSNNVYAVKKNGTISVVVKDALGNTTSRNVTIGNIDDMGPEIKYSFSPNTWTGQKVTVSIMAEDKNKDGSAGVGLPSNYISFDSGKTWGSTRTYDFSQNGSVTVMAKDLYGNQSSKTIAVSTIDKTKPDVSLTYENRGTKKKPKIVLIAIAKDGQSGLADLAYHWSTESAYGNAPEKEVSQNGVYTVTISDRVGNTNSASIEISEYKKSGTTPPTITPPTPPVTPPSTPPSTTPEDEEPTEETETWTEEEATEVETETETDTEAETETESIIETETETEVYVEQETYYSGTDAQEMQTLERNSLSGVILAVSLLSVGLLSGLVFAFLWYHTIAVYCEIEGDDLDFLGRVWIGNTHGKFTVRISEKMWQQCTTTHFTFKPSHIFITLHGKDEITFLFPEDKWATLPVERKMDTVLL